MEMRKPNKSIDDVKQEVVRPVEVAEQNLITFITTQIERMKEFAQLGSGKEPTFYEVNQALCSYQDTNLALIALYNVAKIDHNKAKEIFDDWYARVYIETRQKVNPLSLSAQKWYSQKEVDMIVRFENKEEYHRLSQNAMYEDQRVAFLRRILENWSQYAYILTQLSKNLVSEITGLGVEGALTRITGES
jgi:hypothetical protein